ncbi:hypothetical protein SAMN05880582_1011591 [Rhizobium sp. RU20A]|uniref:hypothetical protein n=1 Tax=Rhizobium sp. RU20A TaxID=1907412 RepID=UPI000953BD5B|nr:hypothetical protein [Rhizobium sp. RU20A]SIQ35869.1 hypothetical protein SAMN05880582_1011591 [Rhizobium sp. RU20A]
MPTLFRFLFFCGMIAGSIYAVMFALATFVEPREREVTIRIPSERLNPQPATPATTGAIPATTKP